MRDQELITQSYTNLRKTRLHEACKAGSAINIKQWYYWALFDLFGDLLLNGQLAQKNRSF